MTTKEPLIVLDAGIPAAEALFEGLGRTCALPAGEIDRSALEGADVLVIRSITRVDAALLEGTPVRFVGTATSGTDHVDRAWLRRNGIRFAHARGANAESVGDYVIAALLRIAVRRGMSISGRIVGIVGCGEVGGRLAGRLPALGVRVLQCDPPKARRMQGRGVTSRFVSLDRILAESDTITLHTPHTRHGRHPTHHLVNTEFLEAMRPSAWLLNSSRGGVADSRALLDARGRMDALVLDVFEGEPEPDPMLVDSADLATAHIAGYAIDSKLEATRRMAAAVARHLGVPAPAERVSGSHPITLAPPGAADDTVWLDALVRAAYPIERDDAALRAVVASGPDRGDRFEDLRRGYPERRLLSRHAVDPSDVPEHLRGAVYDGLRMRRAGR